MKRKGEIAEAQAAAFLTSQGYRLHCKNYRCRYGEIDIIAWEGKTLCFIEVKSRASREFGIPAEAVNRKKQRKIGKVAAHYLVCHFYGQDLACRFDVVSVLEKQIPEIFRDAFQLSATGLW
ncbi:YraN family protein [bacterium]|nr:YraN family protein [bacterium]